MTEWNEARSNYIRMEKLCMGIGTICVIWGIIFDVLVSKGIVFHEVDSLIDYSMVLLQIQASIGTLTIAIIALISGNITDSYMGVSISDYYLNIRPGILKQKRIIFASLILIVANAIFHMWELYNLVIFTFVITFILVGVSIVEIYSVFGGKRKMQKEIEKYYKHVMQTPSNYQEKLELCSAFIEDWKEIAKTQNEEEFEKYTKLLTEGIGVLLNAKTDQSIKDINKLTHEISINLLSGTAENEKQMGIVFVQEVYRFLWMYILDNKNEEFEFNERITLFGSIVYEFVDAVDSLAAEKIEKIIRIDSFADNILRVSYWIGYDAESSKVEIGYVNSLIRHIGYYLSKQYKRGNPVDEKYWGNSLRSCLYQYTANVPTELVEEYANSRCFIQFDYCYSLLMSGETDIVKENLYYYSMANSYQMNNVQYAILGLSVHCFLYYLGYRESEVCVSLEIKEKAQGILNDSRVKNAFSHFLYQLSECQEWLGEKLELEILRILDRHELFPKYSNSKTMISDLVVKDFYLFIILYLAHEYYIPELVEKALDDNRYLGYAYEVNNAKTRELLMTLYSLIDNNEKDEDAIKNNVELMFEGLEKRIKSKYKERLIQKVQEAQKKYKETVDVRAVCASIKKNTVERLNKKFEPILIEEDVDNPIIDVKVFTLSDYTESINGELQQSFYSDLFGNLVAYLIWYLQKNNVVDVKNRREDYIDDRHFMRFLQDNNLTLLMGAKYILSNRDYKLRNEFNSFVEDFECIYTTLVREGVALKRNGMKICLHDVNVTVRPGRIQDMNIKVNKETGKYVYAPISDMPIEFEKEEIKEFIHNERKIIEISVKISVQTNGEHIGTVITDRKTQ